MLVSGRLAEDQDESYQASRIKDRNHMRRKKRLRASRRGAPRPPPSISSGSPAVPPGTRHESSVVYGVPKKRLTNDSSREGQESTEGFRQRLTSGPSRGATSRVG